jgi:hypothetical protein
MTYTFTALAGASIFFSSMVASAQTKSYPLNSSQGIRLHNVVVEPATLEGKRGLRVTSAPDAGPGELNMLAVIEDTDFSNGVIEAEIAGAPAAGAGTGARGFVGIAFRVRPDLKTYDAFYLRPTNGRADDQERRNHSTQYISHPDWTWSRLRQETPSRYESYVDVVPNTWTKIRIDVRGDKARLYVNDSREPVLIVNDLKTSATGRGGVALWIGVSTVAHFRNVTVAPGTTP